MTRGIFIFSGQWISTVQKLPETGMGYTVVSIRLHDGREFKQAVIDSGRLTRIRGSLDIPFTEADIADIRPTHEKWDWKSDPCAP
jgi:hypothetical protein